MVFSVPVNRFPILIISNENRVGDFEIVIICARYIERVNYGHCAVKIYFIKIGKYFLVVMCYWRSRDHIVVKGDTEYLARGVYVVCFLCQFNHVVAVGLVDA